jgi:hypothetical protein
MASAGLPNIPRNPEQYNNMHNIRAQNEKGKGFPVTSNERQAKWWHRSLLDLCVNPLILCRVILSLPSFSCTVCLISLSLPIAGLPPNRMTSLCYFLLRNTVDGSIAENDNITIPLHQPSAYVYWGDEAVHSPVSFFFSYHYIYRQCYAIVIRISNTRP